MKNKDRSFYVNFIDAGNCEINPHPIEIVASSLAHAMQKAAAIVPDDAIDVTIHRLYQP